MPMDWRSIASYLTGDSRARAINPTTGESGPWQPYNPLKSPETLAPMAGSPDSAVGRPMNILLLKNKYTKAISDGRFDEADAYMKQIEALQNPNAIPEGGDFQGGI